MKETVSQVYKTVNKYLFAMAVFSFHTTDDESKRKIKVAIRPLSPNGNISGTVDDIKNSVSQLRLSPTAALVSI